MTQAKLPSGGGSYLRDDKGELKRVEKPAAPAPARTAPKPTPKKER